MKFALIAAVSALSTLVSGLALPDLTPRGAPIRPSIAQVIKEDAPNTPFPATIVEVSRKNGAHNVKTLLGFVIPACSGKCTISFSDAISASDSRRLQLFTSGAFPSVGNTWSSKPFTNNHIGTFQLSGNGAGPATAVESFGLTFDCPTSTTNFGYEVQPVWDNDSVTWNINTGGFVITC